MKMETIFLRVWRRGVRERERERVYVRVGGGGTCGGGGCGGVGGVRVCVYLVSLFVGGVGEGVHMCMQKLHGVLLFSGSVNRGAKEVVVVEGGGGGRGHFQEYEHLTSCQPS